MAEDPTSSQSPTTTVEQCQFMIQKSLRTPTVRFLREQLEKAGCGVADNFIKAVNCEQRLAGGYMRGEGSTGSLINLKHVLDSPYLIVVCSNNIEMQDEVDQVLIHELIHAFDDCRAANLEWTNCAHHACSEIRAGHLSGDCHYKRELLRGFLKIRGHEQETSVAMFPQQNFQPITMYKIQIESTILAMWGIEIQAPYSHKNSPPWLDCIRRRVLKSLSANPDCSGATVAKDSMEAVWDVCYNDTEPFGRVP
ncbi:hypothetical protein Lal_00014321 [Lupinus albus]|nr:hypothetical protein Lal_00014321 [Lupinus albus]